MTRRERRKLFPSALSFFSLLLFGLQFPLLKSPRGRLRVWDPGALKKLETALFAIFCLLHARKSRNLTSPSFKVGNAIGQCRGHLSRGEAERRELRLKSAFMKKGPLEV